MKGVILAAGKGTRMLPLTERRPKPLVPVLDRPMIEHIISGACAAGFDHLCLIVGHLGDMIVEALGDGSRLGAKIEYVWQTDAGGTGAAVLLAEDFVGGQPFFLSWGDIVVGPKTYANLADIYREDKPPAILSLNRVDDPCEGAAVYVRDGYVEKIIEKPPRGASTTNYNNAGVFVFGPEVFQVLRDIPLSPRGEKEMTDAIQAMLSDGVVIRGNEIEGYWSDVARPATVLRLNEEIVWHRSPQGIIVDPSAQVAAGAELQAPVFIGPGCRVEDARIGPNVVLAGQAQVAAGAELEQVAAFGPVRIGAAARARWTIIEEDAELAAGQGLCGDVSAPAVLRRTGT